MLITVLGLPSPLSERTVPALRLILQAALGSVDFLHFTTIEQLHEQWVQRQSDHVILHTDNPDARIANLLTVNAKNIIFISEDPVEIALHFRDSVPLPLDVAIHSTSSIFASLHDIVLKCPNLLAISSQNSATPMEFIANILSFFDLSLSDGQFNEILRVIAESDENRWPSGRALKSGVRERLNQNEQALVESLTPYRSMFRMKPTARFNWPRGLFFGTDRTGALTHTRVTEVIELVGPARLLCYGPYLHLPPGEWILNTSFEVSGNYSGNELLLEVIAGHEVLIHRPALLPIQGRFSFEIPFSVEEPREPIVLRVWMRQGAIEGTFALLSVNVHRSIDQ